MKSEKDYIWLKLQKDFFQSKEIKVIQKIPEGHKYIVVWLKLLLHSLEMQEKGILRFSDNLPYSPEMLATVLEEDPSLIVTSLQIFMRYDMIRIMSDGEIWIEKIHEMTGSRDTSYLRMRKMREKRRQISQKDNGDVTVTNELFKCDDTDIEVEVDKEVDIENVRNKSSTVTIYNELKSWYSNKYPDHFKSKNDWILESPAIKKLVIKSEVFLPSGTDCERKNWIADVIEIFEDMCSGKIKHFLKDTPPIPSKLVSKGIWPYVIEMYSKIHKEGK